MGKANLFVRIKIYQILPILRLTWSIQDTQRDYNPYVKKRTIRFLYKQFFITQQYIYLFVLLRRGFLSLVM